MKKIPTLFVRDENDRRRLTAEVTPGCEWVLAGEGQATRKFDGTCVLIDRSEIQLGSIMLRREVKPGKPQPDGFRAVEYDPVTGKTVGWQAWEMSDSGFFPLVQEALDRQGWDLPDGTYELCGPKVNGNPEGYDHHVLIRHGVWPLDVSDLTFDGIRAAVLAHPFEGIVWHHPDGRMAKVKRRDFTSTFGRNFLADRESYRLIAEQPKETQ